MYENIFLMKYVYFNFEIVIMLLGLDIVVVIMIWVEFVGSWFCVIFQFLFVLFWFLVRVLRYLERFVDSLCM